MQSSSFWKTQNYCLESAWTAISDLCLLQTGAHFPQKIYYRLQDNRIWRLETWINKDEAYASIYLIFKILALEPMYSACNQRMYGNLSFRQDYQAHIDIRSAMKQIGKGNMEAEVPVSGEDETGWPAATMNRMSKNRELVGKGIRREETNQRLRELKAMQYQINPHFSL